MVKCDKCGLEIYMPFRCNYCGGYFCEQHRLPEFHNCRGTFNSPRNIVQIGSYSSTASTFGNYSTTQIIRPYWFSKREIRDLIIGLLIITIIPLTQIWKLFFDQPLFVVGITIIFTLAFMLHELAHKFVAQRQGMFAEFRLSTIGLMLTLTSFLLLRVRALPLMIVAPGAVMIIGLLNWNDYGRISIAGPATNILQALIYLFVNFATPYDGVIWSLTYIGMAINSSLALFNLIPFGIFDGMKIFKWNKLIWLIAVIISGMIFLYTMF